MSDYTVPSLPLKKEERAKIRIVYQRRVGEDLKSSNAKVEAYRTDSPGDNKKKKKKQLAA